MSELWPALMGRVNQHLGIRSRDWPLLLLMLAHVFVALTLTISLRSLNTGLFLSAYPATVYPWYFLAESVLSFILSLVYSNFVSGRVTPRQENLGLLAIFAGVMVVGRAMLWQHVGWVNFALPMVCDSLSSLLMIQAWTLYGDCVDSRKARRIFPLIGLGGTCGGIFGGWLASSLVGMLGTENLIFIELLLLVLLAAGVIYLLRRAKDPGLEQKMEQKLASGLEKGTGLVQRSREVVTSVLANKLLVRVLLILICVRVASTILDYQLQLQLKANFNQTGITAYMGSYFALTSFVTLVIQLTIENRIINSQGVVWGMGSTPLTLGGGLIGFLLAPSLLSATFAKFFEQITRNSLFKTAVELVYIPFESSLRRKLRIMVNGILSLTTVPLASVTIMVFSTQLHVLGFIAFVFAVLGLVFSVLLQGPYTRKLHDALMRRQLLIDTPDQVTQAFPAEAIEKQLTRGDIGMILFALDLLKRQELVISPDKLQPLLFHDNAFVREGALHVLRRQGSPEHAQLALDILVRERDPRVREACLEVLREFGDETLNERVMPFLDDPSLPVRAECVLFLFTKGGIEGILAGAERLKEMLDSENDAELAHVAYIIGEIGIRYFRTDFLELLRHPSERVRRAVLQAAAVSLPEDLLTELLPLLKERALARLARQALLTLPAEQVLAASMQCLREQTQDVPWQLELVRVIAGFHEPEAINHLMELLAEPDIRIKHVALQGLIQLRRSGGFDGEPYRARIYAQLQREFYYGYHYFMLLTLIRRNPADLLRGRFLQSEIKHKIRFVQEMIFRLLGLLHPPEEIYKAFLNYRSQSAHFRALSLEVLSYTLENELLERVLTFLDDVPYDNKIALAREHDLIDETIGLSWWNSAVIVEDPWLRRLAAWCRGLETPDDEEHHMFEILDKMFLLKQTPVFEKFSADQLYPVAMAAREQYVPAQSLIFRQAQPGDAFYIISSGTVSVERSGVQVTTLGEKDVFGELEVLNAEPRLAAIRTLTECELLVISREDFIDLVEEYSDFSRGLLEVMSDRLAAHVLKLSRTQPLGTGSLWSERTDDWTGLGL